VLHAVRAVAGLACLALLAARGGAAPGLAAKHDDTPATVSAVKRDEAAGGQHWRLATARGPIHVWRPPGYRARSAGIVLYVHGYNIRVDQAWEVFKLAQQFHDSRQNALYIVPEAPTGSGDRVKWPTLARLLRAVARGTRLALPRGHVVAVGHSGAFRTLASWLDHRYLDHVILLDALYANDAEFESWIDSGPRAAQHKLTIVAQDTRGQSEAFARRLRHAAMRKTIPASVAELSRRERRARVLYLRSQYGHNEMVQNGRVIPLLLRATRLRLLK
jgi:hypothetical protein